MKVRILKRRAYTSLAPGVKVGGVYEADDVMRVGVDVICPETGDIVFLKYDAVRFICPGVAVPNQIDSSVNICPGGRPGGFMAAAAEAIRW